MRPSAGVCWLVGLAATIMLSLADRAQAERFTASPGADLASILADMQDGDELVLQAGRYAGGLVIDGISVRIYGPKTGKAVIAPSAGSNFLVAVEGGGTGEMGRLTFAPSEAAPLALYVQNSDVSCSHCSFADTPGTPIYLEAGGLALSDSVVTNVAGNAIVALQGSSVTLEGTTFREVTDAALVAREAASTALTNVDIDAGAGVLISNAGGSNLIERVHIIARNEAALQLEGEGQTTISDSWLNSAATGLVAIVGDSASVTISGTTAIGATGALYVESSQGAARAVSIKDNLLLATGAEAYVLRVFGSSADMAQNVLLSTGNGLFIGEETSARLAENLVVAAGFGIAVSAENRGVTTLRNDLVVAATPLSDGVSADLGTTRLLGAVSANEETVAAINADSGIALASATLADAGALARSRQSAATLRQAAAAIATLQLILADAAGRERPASFTVFDAAGGIIAEAEDGSPLTLAPGSYSIAPQVDLQMRTPVTIEAGETAAVRVKIPRSVWLPFAYGDGSGAPILFRALPVAEAQRLIRSNAFEPFLETVRAFPRAEATPEDIAHALHLAREAVAPLAQLPVTQPEEVWSKTAQARTEARRILAVYGNENDAELLLKSVLPIWGDDLHGAVAAAYAEARLGRLGNGVVRAALDADDERQRYAAALALGALGHPDIAAYLLRWIENGTGESQDQIRYIARSMGHTTVTNAYRKVVASYIADAMAGKAPYFPFVGMEHLVAFGNADDWELLGQAIDLADASLHVAIAVKLAAYASEPLTLTDLIASHMGEDNSVRNQVLICPLLRLRGADAFERLNQGMQEQLNSWYGRGHYVQYYLEAGGCWPNEVAAEYYHTGETSLAEQYFALPWMPEPWHEAELLEYEAAGTLNESYFDFVDYVPYERVAGAYAVAGETQIPNPQLRLAYRKVLTRAGHYPELHAYEDGLERRPYLLRHVDAPDYSGAISGMAVVDPQLGEDTDLVIRLRFEQVAYYHGCCDLASTIDNNNDLSAWLHAPFLDDGGSALVQSIRLTRYGTDVPIRITGPHARGWRIAAGPSPGGLAGLVLTVELELFGDRRLLTFDLFASARARGFTRDPA